MARARSLMMIVAIPLIAVGAYGVYRASPGFGRTVVDGRVVAVHPHTGQRGYCERDGRRVRRTCIRFNAWEPYTYYTEVAEYVAPDGRVLRGEDTRERGGERDKVGDRVKVVVTPASEAAGTLEIAPTNLFPISFGILCAGLGLLASAVIWKRVAARDEEEPPELDRAERIYRATTRR